MNKGLGSYSTHSGSSAMYTTTSYVAHAKKQHQHLTSHWIDKLQATCAITEDIHTLSDFTRYNSISPLQHNKFISQQQLTSSRRIDGLSRFNRRLQSPSLITGPKRPQRTLFCSAAQHWKALRLLPAPAPLECSGDTATLTHACGDGVASLGKLDCSLKPTA